LIVHRQVDVGVIPRPAAVAMDVPPVMSDTELSSFGKLLYCAL